jgi:hypothetical protein
MKRIVSSDEDLSFTFRPYGFDHDEDGIGERILGRIKVQKICLILNSTLIFHVLSLGNSL